jgi:mercuric ion binding protein
MNNLIAISIIMVLIIFPAEIIAVEEAMGPVKVTVRVDGLSCPFCAYGLEKKIKKMKGVEDLTIFVERGKVEVIFEDKKFFEREKLEEAAKNAGFTPGEITVKYIVD